MGLILRVLLYNTITVWLNETNRKTWQETLTTLDLQNTNRVRIKRVQTEAKQPKTEGTMLSSRPYVRPKSFSSSSLEESESETLMRRLLGVLAVLAVPAPFAAFPRPRPRPRPEDADDDLRASSRLRRVLRPSIFFDFLLQ